VNVRKLYVMGIKLLGRIIEGGGEMKVRYCGYFLMEG
jgi:hypothetical protein